MINFFYLLQIVVIGCLIAVVMIQKSSDGIFSSSKVFGIRGRSNAIVKLTYFLFFSFIANNIFLVINYKKTFENSKIQETKKNNLEK